MLVIADAAHTTKANCWRLSQEQGADYLFFLKGNQPHAHAKAQQLLAGLTPPQVQSTTKDHGWITQRQLWTCPVDPASLGLAGAAQVFRLDQHTDYLRRGQVVKTTRESRFGVTTLHPDQANPDALLALVRGYWAIEIRQHYRRDHTQREDHCHVRHPTRARNLALMRSLAIFLYEQQRACRHGKTSLPDWQTGNHRNPNPPIRRFLSETR